MFDDLDNEEWEKASTDEKLNVLRESIGAMAELSKTIAEQSVSFNQDITDLKRAFFAIKKYIEADGERGWKAWFFNLFRS